MSEGGEVLSVSLSDGSARIALAKDKFSNEVEQVSSGGAPCSLSPDGKFVAHVERDKNGNYACILQPLFSENPRKARSSVSGPSEVVFDMKRLLLFPQSGNPLARPFRYFGRIGQDAAGGGEVLLRTAQKVHGPRCWCNVFIRNGTWGSTVLNVSTQQGESDVFVRNPRPVDLDGIRGLLRMRGLLRDLVLAQEGRGGRG